MQTGDISSTKRSSGNIILVGMMGSGKTTVGRLLAKQLGKTFVDSDEEIQKRTGVTIQHIFDVEGRPVSVSVRRGWCRSFCWEMT